jgi:hypothetical protein
MQAPGHVHMPMGHEYRASGGLDSSETLWFCLGPQGSQLPSTISRRMQSLGHIGLTVWEDITGREELYTRLPFLSKLLANGEDETTIIDGDKADSKILHLYLGQFKRIYQMTVWCVQCVCCSVCACYSGFHPHRWLAACWEKEAECIILPCQLYPLIQ